MKLAELLLRRAALQKHIAGLRERIARNAVAQEGSQPHENAEQLLTQALQANSDLGRVVLAINRANLAAQLADGRSITQAIADRDTLAGEHALLKAAAAAALQEPDRYSSRELRWISQLSVSDLEARADKAAEALRVLNVGIQQANWLCEVETP